MERRSSEWGCCKRHTAPMRRRPRGRACPSPEKGTADPVVAHDGQRSYRDNLEHGWPFSERRAGAKEDCKTIIPVTVESANRTSKNTKAHPLCDQLRYLAPFGGEKFAAYLEQLNRWTDSPFSQPNSGRSGSISPRAPLSAILPQPGLSRWTERQSGQRKN
ncbi:MAG: type I-C CRISPR-associated protein Cas8c/Csd1 [Hydrogeniiclostridium mannosilyticum]